MKAPGWVRQLDERSQESEPPAKKPNPPHPLPRALRTEFAVIGVCFGILGTAVKVWLRPREIGGPEWSFLYAVAPSFSYALGVSLISAAWKALPLRSTLWFAGGMLAYEITQPFIPRRRFDPFDIVAILVAIGIYLAYRRWRTRGRAATAEA